METMDLKVQGMRCESCANALASSLRVLPGVHRVDPSPETGDTRVIYDPRKVQPDAIRRQIEAAGFDVVGG